MKIKYLKNPKSIEFMDTMNLYMEVFPHDWDYIPVIRRLIKNKINKNRKLYLLAAIKNYRIIGAILYSFWKDTQIGLLEYLFIKQNLRSKGIGTLLYKKMIKHINKLKGKYLIFSAARDEKFEKSITNEEIKIRQRRLKFYEKLGARPIKNFKYENPLHLSRIQEDYHSPYLLLDTKFLDTIKGKDLYDLVKRNYKRFYYGATTKNNEIAKKVLKSINKEKNYNLRPLKYIKNE